MCRFKFAVLTVGGLRKLHYRRIAMYGFRFTFCDEICPSLKDIPHDTYTCVSRFFTFLSSPVIIWFIKRGYTIVTVRGKDSDDRNQPIGFGLKNIVPTSTVNITGAGKTATAALYTLRPSTTKVFIYTSLLFKQNRSVTQGGFCYALTLLLSFCYRLKFLQFGAIIKILFLEKIPERVKIWDIYLKQHSTSTIFSV